LDDLKMPAKVSLTEKAKIKFKGVKAETTSEIDGEGIRRILRSCSTLSYLNFDYSKLKTYLLKSIVSLNGVVFEYLHTLQVLALALPTTLFYVSTYIFSIQDSHVTFIAFELKFRIYSVFFHWKWSHYAELIAVKINSMALANAFCKCFHIQT
jgi:hypothetical protein